MNNIQLVRIVFKTVYPIVSFGMISCQLADQDLGIADKDLVLADTFDTLSLNQDKWGVSFWPLEQGIQPAIVDRPT